MRRPSIFACLLVFCLVSIGCAPAQVEQIRAQSLSFDKKENEKPSIAVRIDPPLAELPRDGERDLEKADARELGKEAWSHYREGNYELAARYQYWHCAKLNDKRYDLACYYAKQGNNDAAFYYLQVAALEDVVDPDWAEEDEDLIALRRDGRWASISPFLRECAAYWASKGTVKVLLPSTHAEAPGNAITTIVCLHGAGATPDDFVNENSCQGLADWSKVAFVGVSGTTMEGKQRYAWLHDPEQNWKRIQAALKEVSDKVKPGKIILMGFGQGGQVAMEIAVRHPEEIAGAIVLSPGDDHQLTGVSPSPLLSKRGFVITHGAKELSTTVKLASHDASWLMRAKAKLIHKPYPNVGTRALPADFDRRFPEWVRFIEQAEK